MNFALGLAAADFTNGVVKGSVFHGAFIGVLIADSTKAEVIENHMSGGVDVTCLAGDCAAVPVTLESKGISVGGFTNVTGAKIAKNHVHDNTVGIRLADVTGSEVSDNEVHVNTADGIRLQAASTGNTITNNTSTGNGDGATTFDMFHDGGSSPNFWSGNKCASRSGADIDC